MYPLTTPFGRVELTLTERGTGHPYVRSFEPGESWYWDYRSSEMLDGPELADPQHHPLDQPVPGPAGRVPSVWRRHIH